MRGLDANVMAQMKQVAVTRVTHCDPVVPPKWDLSPQMHPDQKLNGFEELSSRQKGPFRSQVPGEPGPRRDLGPRYTVRIWDRGTLYTGT